MPNAPFAALFDMDGVLIDNADFHLNAWLQFAQNHGLSLTRDQYMDHINGHISADSLAYVLQRAVTPAEVIILTEEKEAIYRELYRPHLRPTPGLITFLMHSKERGFQWPLVLQRLKAMWVLPSTEPIYVPTSMQLSMPA